MSDPFVPEADALEQEQEVTPGAGPPDDENQQEPPPALIYPERLPDDASEADALDQNQTVDIDDRER